MDVKPDLISGSEIIDDVIGTDYVRTFAISNIPVNATGPDSSVQQQALNQMPAIGSLHPSNPNAYCVRRTVRGLGGHDNAIGEAAYHQVKQSVILELDAGLMEEDRDFDWFGNSISVPYSVSTQPGQPRNTSDTVPRRTSVRALIPYKTISADIATTGIDFAESVADIYLGMMNANAWRGGAAGTWLCTRVAARSQDYGVTYRMYMSFLWKPQGHLIGAAILVNDAGLPIPNGYASYNPVYQNAFTLVQCYGYVNYYGLGF